MEVSRLGTLTNNQILKWHVQKGDFVDEFQSLCEVQSDKATVEITSRYQGQILDLLHQEGDMVSVGGVLVELEDGAPEGQSDGGVEGEQAEGDPDQALLEEVEQADSSNLQVTNVSASVLGTPSVRR